MAGETVVSFSIGGLRDLLVAEGEYLNALRSPVDELREKLTTMEGLLEYAETRRDQRTKEVVELADKLIDSIESYVVLQVSSKNIITDCTERWIRRKVRSDIQEITTKITDLVNGLSKTIKVGGDSASSSLGLGNANYKVQDLSYLNEDDFVGREKDVENLVNYLIDAHQSRIISILGMGGLGKTTLTRKVYKDKRVVSHFQGFAFVCVSQQCQAEAILRHILQQLAPEKEEEEIKTMSDTDVIEQLQIVHREKSCLVVIDDIWSVDDWKSLSRGLPDGDMDGKVIITTRNQDVAEVGLCYAPLRLSEEEGWKLFQKKIFLPRREFTDSRVDKRMEELGREMIGWCRGIPLAVLVLRGVLVTKATLHEWERFYESRNREVEHKQLYGEVIKELLFSYNELPYQLRPCFLYFGYFLEDEEIEAEKLYMLWDAEGMLLSKDKKEGETMMDVAKRYLGELVRRSMVEAELEEEVNPDTSRRLKSCRLHDLMRELCLSIIRKEKFLKVNDYHTQEIKNILLDISCQRDDTTTPRHAFYFSDDSNFSVQIEQEAAQNVRSLRFVQGNPEKLSNLKKIKFLRVLDFYKVKKNLMKETTHLKYLSFKDCEIDSKLPILRGDFRYLQSLDLRIRKFCAIQNVLLRKLKGLRHLFLPEYYRVTPELSRLRLEGMRELETLVNFDSRKCEIKDVIQVANLRRIEGNIWISNVDDAEDWKGLIGYMKKVDLDSSRRSSLTIFLYGPMMINDLNEQLRGCEGIIREADIVGLRGETVVSFSIGGLRDLLAAEREYLNALKSPVDELREMLTTMEGLLEYAETRRDERTKEIVELADKLIDSTESYVLQVSSKNIITGFRERRIRQKVRLDIQEITTKITDLVNGLSETIKVGGDSASSTLGLGKAYKVQDLSYLNEDDFVGREKDVENLVNYLIDAHQSRIISILGMGGLGKTTLTRKVYKDKRVVSHFQGFAFVCVSQQCQAEAILRHILQQLAPEKKEEEIKTMSDTAVIEQLQIVHREKSCLVVIDDIWSVDDWKSLSRGLPNGDMDSKVIITTRIQDVADVGLCYAPLRLSEEEGWELFQKKIFIRREYTDSRVDQRMEELGREMIGWCRGIPLAVLVLRGVLVTKATLLEWERFYESITKEVEHKQLYGEVIEELLFSYNELPYQLKPCFLYFGYFLEDEEIEAEKLYMLWEAEGMLLSKDREEGETMMDVGERYLGELVGRSMVEAELEEEINRDTSRRFKSCRLHDLMRELCLSIVRKEKFLKVNDYHTQLFGNIVLDISCLRDVRKTPRHAFYFSDYSTFSVQIEQEVAQNVRSLRFVRGYPKKLSNLRKIKFLRVLDFYKVVEMKKNLTKETIHLKYLSFKDCGVDRKLPILLGDFRYLQNLDLRIGVYVDRSSIPNALLRKLKRLRHLFLPEFYSVTPELSRLRLEGMRELETLVNFDSRKCEMKDVIQVANLRRFKGNICISNEDNAEDWKGLISYLKKVDLDSSRRSSLKISLDGPMMINDLIEQLRGCEGIIREANIAGLRGKLPQFFDFTPLLSRLYMGYICLEEDPMPTLEKLQNLEKLTLNYVELNGKEMTCSTMGFPQLEDLIIRNMKNLEKWRVEEGAMRNLKFLYIRGCSKLEMLPDGLKFITALNYLWIGNMPQEFIKRIGVVDGGEEGADFYKIRHVPHVRIGDQ